MTEHNNNMPAKEIPLPVLYARTALEILRTENAEQATAVEKILPGYALKLEKSGTEVTVEILLEAARLGADYFRAPKVESALVEDSLFAYERVINGFDPYKGKTLKEQMNIACEKGDLERVKACHKQGANITARHDAALPLAISNGHLAVVEYLHKHGADITVGSNEALRWAASKGQLAVVEYLHKHGADLTAQNNEALRWAASIGQLALVEFLHKQGVDLTTLNNDALRLAARNGHLAVVEFLHNQGADLTAWDNEPLRGAAGNGHLAVMEYLHKHGADLTAWDNEPLRWAALNGQLAVVEYLHKHGADLTKLSQELKSALKLLAKGRDIWQKIVRMDPPKGLHNENPAFFKKACFEAVVRMLAKEGYKDTEGNTMAFHAAGLFQSEQRVLQYLEQWGVAGKQPLHDLVQMIKLPQKGRPNLKDWGDAVLKCGPSMAKLVKFSDKIPSPVKSSDGRTWSMVNTRAECAKHSFNRAAEHLELAALCFEHDVDEEDFNKALKLVKKGPSETKTIPEITVEGKKFDMGGGKFYRLPANDIRGLFLGEATNCCQSIGNTGGPCAEHGYTSPDGGFFVVENAKGRIVAQSWAWRGEKGEMCFDSLETLGNNVTAEQWRKILQEAVKELTARKDHDITALHVGTGGNTPDGALREAFKKSATAKPRDYSGYRDSKGPQIVVWQR